MICVKKFKAEKAIQYNGYNFEDIKKELEDNAGQISHYMDGMLKVDTQHGRLAVRVAEWITKDDSNCYQVYSNDEFSRLFYEEM